MSNVDNLHASLDQSPDDWLARLALADALEEVGQTEEAMYYRLSVELRMAPGRLDLQEAEWIPSAGWNRDGWLRSDLPRRRGPLRGFYYTALSVALPTGWGFRDFRPAPQPLEDYSRRVGALVRGLPRNIPTAFITPIGADLARNTGLNGTVVWPVRRQLEDGMRLLFKVLGYSRYKIRAIRRCPADGDEWLYYMPRAI